ncbi:hypothetical protein Lal_00005835 [Lupinus albus]|nr:hypothetical protein Lal_00005835 [Lupinus albus]
MEKPFQHPIDNIIGDISKEVITPLKLNDDCLNMAFVSEVESSNIDDVIEDEHMILVMQEHLN